MKPKPWQSAHLSELESLPGPGTLRWTPVRRAFGITAFGINAYTAAKAGQDVVEEHTEQSLGHEEMYIVISGRATFELDGEEVDAPAGTLVFLADPAVKRYAQCGRAGDNGAGRRAVSPACTTCPPWEWFFAAYAYADEGEHEKAIAELQQGLEERPAHPPLLYHLACVEARAGRRDDALEHLSLAVMGDPKLRDHAEDGRRLRLDPRRSADPRRLGVARQPQATGQPRSSPTNSTCSGTRGSRTTPCRAPRNDSTSPCSPTASANALCACSPPNGTTSSGRARPARTSPYVAFAHRDVDDDRGAVGAREADRERIRADERLPAGRVGKPGRRGRGQDRNEAAFGKPAHPVAKMAGRERVRGDESHGPCARRARPRRAPRGRGSRARHWTPTGRGRPPRSWPASPPDRRSASRAT